MFFTVTCNNIVELSKRDHNRVPVSIGNLNYNKGLVIQSANTIDVATTTNRYENMVEGLEKCSVIIQKGGAVNTSS